jgi:hypothetical protein
MSTTESMNTSLYRCRYSKCGETKIENFSGTSKTLCKRCRYCIIKSKKNKATEEELDRISEESKWYVDKRKKRSDAKSCSVKSVTDDVETLKKNYEILAKQVEDNNNNFNLTNARYNEKIKQYQNAMIQLNTRFDELSNTSNGDLNIKIRKRINMLEKRELILEKREILLEERERFLEEKILLLEE